MARSKRKPFIKDHTPGAKRVANKAVRQYKDVPSGKAYKKVYNSYNISDFNFPAPKDKKAYRK